LSTFFILFTVLLYMLWCWSC